MAAGTALRIGTAAILALLLAAILVALALGRRREPEAKAPWLGHVEELRRRLLWPIAVLVTGTLFALTFRLDSWHGLVVPQPALFDNLASQVFRTFSARLVPEGVSLVVTTPLDGFTAQFAVAASVGLAAALPVTLYQLGRFAAPAMRPSERRVLAQSVVPATGLFVAGAAFAYLAVLPVTFAALYQFGDALGAQGLLQVSAFSSFTLAFLLGFGVAFQLPLAMAVLSRIGIVAPQAYWRRWRHALVILLAVGMVLTPDPTIVSQVLLALPLFLLYLLGATLASRVRPPNP